MIKDRFKLNKHLRFLKSLRFIFLSFFSMSVLILNSQNEINEIISADYISKVLIDGNQIFEIEIVSKQTEEIEINSLIDGEYQNAYKIFSKIKGDQLFLKLQKTPLYTIPDDKRNAHMVVAAILKVEIPENLDITIKSDIGSVDALGKFNTISIELFQGSVNINGFAKRAMINTFDGNIAVITENTTIEATSNNGKITVPKERFKNAYWILKSIDGDITVVKPN